MKRIKNKEKNIEEISTIICVMKKDQMYLNIEENGIIS